MAYGDSGLLPSWLFDERFGQDWPQMQTAPQGFNGGYMDYRWGPENDGGKAFNQFDVSRRYDGSGLDPRSIGESVLTANDPNMPPPPYQAPQQPMGPLPPQPAPGWPNGPPTRFAGQDQTRLPPGATLAGPQPLPPPQGVQAQPSIGDRLGAAGKNLLMMTVPMLGMALEGAQTGRSMFSDDTDARKAAFDIVQADNEIDPALKRALMQSGDLSQQFATQKLKQFGDPGAVMAQYKQWKKEGGQGGIEHFVTNVLQREKENFALGQPVYSYDPKTKTIRQYQLGNRGSLNEVKTPDGQPLTLKPRIDKTATDIIYRNPLTLEEMHRESLNTKEGAALEAEGKIRGPIRANMPKIETAATTLLDRLTVLENHPGMKTAVGQFAGRAPEWIAGSLPGKLGEDYLDFKERTGEAAAKLWTAEITKMVNLGALSNAEGSRLTEAAGRLSTIKSEKDFRAAIKDIKDGVKKGLEDSRKVAGTEAPAAPSAPSGPIKWGRDPKTGLPVRQ